MNFKHLTFFVGLFFLFSFFSLHAQTTDTTKNNLPNLYLSCDYCDFDYIRQNITFVNYVRQRQEADIHIIIGTQETGSGGTKYIIRFYGHHQFDKQNDTLSFSLPPGTSDDNERKAIVKTMKIGLFHYLTETPLFNNLNLEFDTPEEKSKENKDTKDPWNHWVFRLGMFSWLNGQLTYKTTYLNAHISANRITEKWKYEFRLSNNYNESHYYYMSKDITSLTRSYNYSQTIVKSIGKHFASGLIVEGSSSTYENYNLDISAGPGIEYNVFPYEEANEHQFRMRYTILVEYADYSDTTIFDKKQEILFKNQFGMGFAINQQWGSIGSYVWGSAFWHDFSENSIGNYTHLSLNLFKGFQLTLEGSVRFVHNQRNLVKAEASMQDVLLRNREMPTEFSYNLNIGFNYTFGSLYNNIVNIRFDD
jgi:hypothetical protein